MIMSLSSTEYSSTRALLDCDRYRELRLASAHARKGIDGGGDEARKVVAAMSAAAECSGEQRGDADDATPLLVERDELERQ